MNGRKAFLTVFLAMTLFAVACPGAVSGQPGGPQSSKPKYTRSDLTYDIDENLDVSARLKFELINEDDSDWSLRRETTVPTSDVTDVKVRDNAGGRINLEVEEGVGETTIKTDLIIYSGESMSYFLSYEVGGLVTENGPKKQLKTSLGSIGSGGWVHENLTVRVNRPPGAKLFTYSPEDAAVEGRDLSYSTRLGEESSFEGLRGTWYGSPAYYRVTLNEEITNETEEDIGSIKYDLSLFNKSDNWQTPALVSIPSNLEAVYLDGEKNWRAVLGVELLEPGESVRSEIELVHEVRVHDPGIDREDTGDLSEIPENMGPFLEPTEKWGSDNQTVRVRGERVVNGENNSYVVARRIIRFVIDRLDYEIQEGDRLGALKAMLLEKGDCSEYTDLSVALARAMGLPARASYGWGYRDGDLIPHAWPEFYLPGVGWQPADPTWADTGGNISPGGLRGKLPPFKGSYFAPRSSSSPESYLGRLDSIHLQRNIAWLDSSESYGNYSYRNGEPNISENLEVEVLSRSEASEEFLSAAQTAVDLASNLVDDGEDALGSELGLAQNYLEAAEGAGSVSEVIDLSQESLEHSGEVIRSEGSPPGDGDGGTGFQELSDRLILATTIVVIIVVISAVLWLKNRG